MTDWNLTIDGGLGNVAPTGADTIILAMPKEFYISVGDTPPALNVIQLAEFLRGVSQAQAHSLKGILHHATYVITRDPAVVHELGIMPEHLDCLDCQRGVSDSIIWLLDHPDDELLVGHLFLADVPIGPLRVVRAERL